MSDWPEIEYEESYPVDEDFVAWGKVSSPALSFERAGEWLLRELPRAAENMPCWCRITRGKNIIGKPVHRISFSTGGWSGAESIIGLIQRRADLQHLMLSWRRGGHYVFEIPIKKSSRSVGDIRKQAWATRRARYGERGHAGSYARLPTDPMSMES
jgi:hypothetical protein